MTTREEVANLRKEIDDLLADIKAHDLKRQRKADAERRAEIAAATKRGKAAKFTFTNKDDYTKIYKTWAKLPATRLRIALYGDGGENVWAKRLPNGLVGIDNSPLHTEYRWMDIVQERGTNPKLIHRRWQHRVWFWYTAGADEKADLKIRRKLAKLVTGDDAHISFWSAGMGYVLCETKEAVARIKAALKPIATKFENAKPAPKQKMVK